MAHPTAHAPTPNEGTGQDEPELTKTGAGSGHQSPKPLSVVCRGCSGSMNSASESSAASHDQELLLISPGGARGERIH